jgi:Cysteine-rich secretory protein family
LQSKTYNSGWLKIVVRVSFGCVAFATATVTTQAQTYTYYPTTSAPNVTTGTTTAPTYYYRKGWFGNRIVWSGYSAPAYQPVNPPQYVQPANQPEPAQSPTEAQVIPASYKTENPAPAATAAPASTDVGDPYGFTGWLNATRAAYGLPAVGYDPNLSGWAAENNNQQAARGMGHFVMGPARRQNAAFGSVSNIGSMWMSSPAHRAALLDPTIRWIGIAGLGAYWTFNAN